MTRPYRYQKEDALQIERFQGRALVASEMGLGKSLEALLYARNADVRPVVVVCPASLKWNWQREASVHFGMRADVLETTKPPTHQVFLASSHILIINYDILRPWLPFLKSLKPQLIILDECHYLMSRGAHRTKATRILCKDVPHVIALSGTPLTNRPSELWPVLNILRPDLYPSFHSYAQRHCSPKRFPWGWNFKGASRLPELHRKLRNSLMIRRRKEDVLKELPSKQRSVVPLELSDRREYAHALKDFLGWLAAQDATRALRAAKAEQLAKLGYLKRLAGTLKLPGVLEWVDSFLAGSDDAKLVLFAIHKNIVKALRARYESISVVVDGSTSGRTRQLAVDQFQRKGGTRLFIGNIRAAGVGLTLTAASTVAFAELDWVPGNHLQAEDRCHRIGTKRPVSIYYLVAKNTIETELMKIIQIKQGVLNSTLDGEGRGDALDIFDQLTQKLQAADEHRRPIR